MDEPAEDPRQTASRLLPHIYDEARRVARGLMARESGGHSLGATALVHEAYLRMAKPTANKEWGGTGHFSAVLVEAMRHILVESARRKKRLKRGGGLVRHDLPGQLEAPEPDDALLALEDALTELASVNMGWAQLVKLRYFLGMTVPEAAQALGVSPRTADAWWTSTRTWMRAKLALDLDAVVT